MLLFGAETSRFCTETWILRLLILKHTQLALNAERVPAACGGNSRTVKWPASTEMLWPQIVGCRHKKRSAPKISRFLEETPTYSPCSTRSNPSDDFSRMMSKDKGPAPSMAHVKPGPGGSTSRGTTSSRMSPGQLHISRFAFHHRKNCTWQDRPGSDR